MQHKLFWFNVPMTLNPIARDSLLSASKHHKQELTLLNPHFRTIRVISKVSGVFFYEVSPFTPMSYIKFLDLHFCQILHKPWSFPNFLKFMLTQCSYATMDFLSNLDASLLSP